MSAKPLIEEVELLDIAGDEFSIEDFLAAKVSPVFFGSALTNFGVEPFFDAFVDLAPCPGPRELQYPRRIQRILAAARNATQRLRL